MSKQQTIEQIQQLTRGVPAGFLDTFDQDTLTRYLTRLTRVKGHRGRGSVWVRADNTPAFTGPGDLPG